MPPYIYGGCKQIPNHNRLTNVSDNIRNSLSLQMMMNADYNNERGIDWRTSASTLDEVV